MAEARIAPGVLDLSDYITTGILATHTAKTTTVHGIADTARLVTIDNIGTYAPAPDLTALVPRDGSRAMTGPLTGASDFTARSGASTQVKAGSVGAGLPGVAFGTGTDATVYRSGGSTIGVGGLLYVQQGSADEVRIGSGGKVQQYSGLAAALRMELGSIGPGGESGLGIGGTDARLYRSGPAAFQIDGSGTPTAANLRVKGVTGQSPMYQEWVRGDGVVIGSIGGNGRMYANDGFSTSAFGNVGTPSLVSPNGTNQIVTSGDATHGMTALAVSAPTLVPFTVKGAAGQSANIQEWQNSAGGILVRVASDGTLYTAGQAQVASYFFAYAGSAQEVALGNFVVNGIQAGGVRFGGDTTLGRVAAGVLAIGTAGGGLMLKSPDGLTTRTISIDNTGTLVLS